MREPGYVYAMVNPSMEGLVKIGKTTRHPETRAKELSEATGVATPFYVAFSIRVSDCHSAEEFVHAVLEHNGFRLNPSREFFSMTLQSAIEVLTLVEQHLLETSSSLDNEKLGDTTCESAGELPKSLILEDDEHPGLAIFIRACDSYWGNGDEIQDCEEALRLLYQAKSLNFPAAYSSLAAYYAERSNEENLPKAMQILREGAEKGHGRCFVQMAELFDAKHDLKNAAKCWKKYFASATFTKDDDLRWTEALGKIVRPQSADSGFAFDTDDPRPQAWSVTGFNGISDFDEGNSRLGYASTFLIRVRDGRIVLDSVFREILLPLREDILSFLQQSLDKVYAQATSAATSQSDATQKFLVSQVDFIRFVREILR